MKRIAILALGALSWALPARAQAPVRVVAGGPAGYAIPDDFSGVGFEISNLLPYPNGFHQFSAEDRPLVALFRGIGFRSLRVGGATADSHIRRAAGPADIDKLFAFAGAAGVKVIYTLRLLDGSAGDDAATAAYIQGRYAPLLDSFEIGNEPDWHAYHTYPGHPLDPKIAEATPFVPGSAYPSFLADWRSFAAAVEASAPGARIGGPDTGSNYPIPGTKDTDTEGESWTQRFAEDEKGAPGVAYVTHHDYVGQNARGVAVQTAIDSLLSTLWVETDCPLLHRHVLAPVLAAGFRYRMTECNDYTGGVRGASNAFASALWALDYMHWQAEHGALGVNFHNNRWLVTDTVYLDDAGKFRMNPKGYGMRAFELGGHGSAEPVSISNPEGVNLTAYAVRGGGGLFVTLINKEHGAGARSARVTIVSGGTAAGVSVMRLEAPQGDPRAMTGITLGGSPMGDDGSWSGHWTPIASAGPCELDLPATSAAVVRIPLP